MFRNLPDTLTPGEELQTKCKRWLPLPMTADLIYMLEERKEKSMVIFLCW